MCWHIIDCGSSSSSTVTNTIHNNYIDKNDLSIFTQNVSKNVATAVVSSSQSTSASSSGTQQLDIKNITFGGYHNKDDLNITATQNTVINVKSIQSSIQNIDLSSVMANAIAAQLKSQSSDTQYNDLIAKGDSSLKQGVGSGILSSAMKVTAKANNNITNNQVIDVDRNFSQQIKNTISQNMNETDVKTCMTKACNTISIELENITFTGAYNQDTGNISMFTQAVTDLVCKELSDQTNTSVVTVMNKLGITSNDTSTGLAYNKAEAEATAAAEDSGIAGVINAIGNAVSKFFGAWTKPLMYVAIACIIVCCLSSFGLIAMMMIPKSKSSSSNDSSDSSDSGDSGDSGDQGDQGVQGVQGDQGDSDS